MPKTITLRLDDVTYQMFRDFADIDNRTLANFIETVAKKYLEEHYSISEEEKKILDRRLESFRKNPKIGIPWSEVKAKLLKSR